VIDWLESILGALGVMAPADNPALTVTVSLGEHDEATGLPWDESVALYEYVVVDVGEAEYVDKVAPEITLPVGQLAAEYH
jgi:hypothetical protein